MQGNLIPYKNKEDALKAASKCLSSELRVALKAKIPVLLLVSGGSALEILEGLDEKLITNGLTLGMLDERFSDDPKVNNYFQLTQTKFFKYCIAKKVKLIDTRVVNGKTADELATRFEVELKSWKTNNSKGKIMITEGVGFDGHTAGIMPFPEDCDLFNSMFLNPVDWVKFYDAKGKNPYPLRITTTLTFLKLVDLSIAFVCGAEKKRVWSRIWTKEDKLSDVPANIIHLMKKVRIFTDISLND